MIDHSDVTGHHGGVIGRQRHRRAAEGDIAGIVTEGRDEHQIGRNRFRPVGDVFAQKRFGIAQLVGQQNRFAVFAEHLPIVFRGRVNGLCKVTEAHA